MMRPRAFSKDQEGVSSVVSAVLVFSLVTVVFSIYMSAIVPEQVADAEASHMRDVASSLAEVASRISASTSLGREGEFSTSIDLGTTTLPGISLFHSSGTLAFEDTAYYSTFECGGARLLSRNQQPAPGGTHLSAAGAPFDFESLLVLNLKINGHTFGPGVTVERTMTVTSGATQVGSVQILLEGQNAASGLLKIKTRAGPFSSTPIYDHSERIDTGLVYNVDLLAPEVGLASVLAESPGPFTITNTTSSATRAQIYALYWKTDGSLATIGDGRALLETFKRSVEPGSLVYHGSNNRFMDQAYVLQGGALVLGEDEGEHLTLAPFSVNPGNLLRLSFIDLSGAGSASGSHRVTLAATIQQPTSSILACTAPSIMTAGDFPIAWHGAWADALSRSGYPEAWSIREGDLVTTKLQGTWNVVIDEAQVGLRVA